MVLILAIVLVALIFEFINGFHDTANAIATSVVTKVMTTPQAVAIAAICNLLGALAGTEVAKTIGTEIVDINFVTPLTLLCALGGAIIWNLVTWWWGLPSSSSHALIGGLCGAALASAHGNWAVIHWSYVEPIQRKLIGLWPRVVAPMFLAPMLGIVLGFAVTGLLLWGFHTFRPRVVNRIFRVLQFFSAAWMSFSSGMNDAQKTMGIIALTLFTATTQTRALDQLPDWLGFLHAPEFKVYTWIKVVCAVTIAAGTAMGSRRIIKTLGKKMVKLQPIHGFAAQSAAAGIIQFASVLGIPLSTTHVVSSTIMGTGITKRFSAVRWSTAERIAWTWVITLPICSSLAYGIFRLLVKLGLTEGVPLP
ncbi:MAG TPA: inorganic phosphate transporter [Verrucomicrobiota bacterium]|jgi:PiT family inorganic phosphate transporter|nr:inorganic phosphate transporter [Verrucomicrobiota bacterium]OQB93394.1 MAG: Low-affinity inorganic phosphate transporter 1 [Verrucomicrobia bacterium ADurb.Bin118]HPY29059.1 inorganic phosphate transporter [Verrucomicrobiota bacterium]HQB16190.1 inorganic phosphate transporter [Verrucomicrobiota bacterium]